MLSWRWIFRFFSATIGNDLSLKDEVISKRWIKYYYYSWILLSEEYIKLKDIFINSFWTRVKMKFNRWNIGWNIDCFWILLAKGMIFLYWKFKLINYFVIWSKRKELAKNLNKFKLQSNIIEAIKIPFKKKKYNQLNQLLRLKSKKNNWRITSEVSIETRILRLKRRNGTKISFKCKSKVKQHHCH